MNQETTNYLRMFATSRRQFLKASAIAGGMTATAAFAPAAVAGFSLGRASAQEGDLGILNFALTLEHFESRLYEVLTGDDTLLSGQALEYGQFYGSQEAMHVSLLTDAISAADGDPVMAQDEYTFPTFANQQEVLEGVSAVEDVGASAYLGAAPLIMEPDYLTVAVQIHSSEAYHATGMRLLAFGTEGAFPEFKDPAFADPRTVAEVTEIVAEFGVMAGMPDTGAGGLATKSRGANVFGVAGLGAVAAAGVGIARSRAAREARQS